MLEHTAQRFFQAVNKIEEKGAQLQILCLTLRKVKEARAGKTAYHPFKCDKCGDGWNSLQQKTGHQCRVLDKYKSGCYCWHTVERSENDNKKKPVVVPLKFGWSDCLREGMRFLSLPAHYCAHSDEQVPNRDREYARKVDSAFTDEAYDGHLYVTFIELGELHDRQVHSAADSQALTKHAEGVCIRDCDRRELLTNIGRQPANIIEGHKNGYAHYESVIRTNYQARNCLRFNREQFNQLIGLMKDNSTFIRRLQAAKNGTLRNVGDVSGFLTKPMFSLRKSNFEDIVDFLIKEQNEMQFKHMPTTEWLYLYQKRQLNPASRKGMHVLF